MIAIGNTNITKAYLGSTELANIAIGDELLLSEPAPLPYDAEVEYLESTGTQYINTGITPQTNYFYFAKFKEVGGSGIVFGSRSAMLLKELSIFIDGNGNFKSRCGNKEYATSGIDYSEKWLNVRYQWGKVLDVDTNQWIISSSNTPPFSTYPLFLFGLNNAGKVAFSKLFIHSFSVKNGNTPLIDLVSVRVGTTGYMYDKVSKTLFGNAGTGNFILGNDL